MIWQAIGLLEDLFGAEPASKRQAFAKSKVDASFRVKKERVSNSYSTKGNR
jgi:hypothetical protein